MQSEINHKRVDKDEVLKLAEQLAILDLQDRKVDFLSGGEAQRVAIARVLISHPSIILADEPTGNLDSKNGDEVISLLKKLTRDRETSVIMVTHNQRYAKYSDRYLTLCDGRLKG